MTVAMETLRIREARLDDARAIRGLLHVMVPLVLPDPSDPAARPFLDSLTGTAVSDRLVAPNYLHLVAERGADFCGYIATRDGSHVYHLFVRPELHRQGIARRLWRQLLHVAGPGPYTVNSTPSAVAVYRSFGFVPSGQPPPHCCPPYVPMAYTVRI